MYEKIISVLVAVSMLCTMLAMPALSASTVSKTYISNTTGASGNNHTAATTVTGVKGRTTDDASTYVTRVRSQHSRRCAERVCRQLGYVFKRRALAQYLC